MMRVVLDANIFASALIQPKGNSGEILRRVLEREGVENVITSEILEEVRRILFYPRVRKRIRGTDEDVDAFLTAAALVSDLVTVTSGYPRVIKKDPDDDKYIAAALEGHAQVIISGDTHLTEVKEYEGIQILSPAEFVKSIPKAVHRG